MIAHGYLPQVVSYIDLHPGLTRDAAVRGWVEERYGGFISTNITAEGFGFPSVGPVEFDVLFQNEAHAVAFLASIGGAVVQEGGSDGLQKQQAP